MEGTVTEHDKWMERITQALRAMRAAGERKTAQVGADSRRSSVGEREQPSR